MSQLSLFAAQEDSPAWQLYSRLKAKHNAVLLFHMDDMYEAVFDDAPLCARLLGLNLCDRLAGSATLAVTGFPTASAKAYIERLVKAGHRVAICEIVEATHA